MMQINKKPSFTLIEVVVTISVLSMVTLTIVGIFSTVVGMQKKVMGIQDVQNSARFLMESLSRELRMAIIDDTGDCLPVAGLTFTIAAAGGTALRFKNYKHECVQYSFVPVGGIIQKTINDGGGPVTMNITENNIKVNQLKFFVRDNRVGGEHPFVTIFMELTKPNFSDEERTIRMQTSLSARSY